MRACVLTDNEYSYHNFKRMVKCKGIERHFDYYYSPFNSDFSQRYGNSDEIKPLALKLTEKTFFDAYDLVLSLHCKQIFPAELVEQHRCINVHPGLNPYNRGWFPHVFSIVNKLPAGVTIHEMDSEIDHGKIICQEQIEINDHETSFDIYQKLLKTEAKLLDEYIEVIMSGNYDATYPICEGNVNYKRDFEAMCALDLERTGKFREFLDILRATTFDQFDNAYFYGKDGKKIYISIKLKKET